MFKKVDKLIFYKLVLIRGPGNLGGEIEYARRGRESIKVVLVAAITNSATRNMINLSLSLLYIEKMFHTKMS